jgi:hypothetical protein
MFYGTQAPFLADGNVSPSRFITTVTGAGNAGKAVQASASTAIIVGISESWRRHPPGSPSDDGFIAIAGESLSYRGPGTIARLKLGGTVSNAGILLTTDGSGQGIAQAPADGTTAYYGAMAMDTGVSGDFIRVVVLAPTPTV